MHTEMFRRFLDGYRPDRPIELRNADEAGGSALAVLLSNLGGRSYNEGLYRIHDEASSVRWTSIVQAAFPNRDPNFHSFGFDWSGRQYCLDVHSNFVVQFDPETGESYATQQTLLDFHNNELADDPIGAVAADEFEAWALLQSSPLTFAECVGYRIPLVLGGEDCLENRERCDMEVYWSFCAQISKQLSDVASGTSVRGMRLHHEN